MYKYQYFKDRFLVAWNHFDKGRFTKFFYFPNKYVIWFNVTLRLALA